MIPRSIRLAAALPLLDAGLLLWLRRRELQRWDGKSCSPRLIGDPAGQIEQAIGALHFERANAAAGPTFDRLNLAHPEADDTSLRDAINRAVRLETDCLRHFERSKAGSDADAQRAVERARVDNPGFIEESYTAAAQYLCTAFR
jgi:hypothetical protein